MNLSRSINTHDKHTTNQNDKVIHICSKDQQREVQVHHKEPAIAQGELLRQENEALVFLHDKQDTCKRKLPHNGLLSIAPVLRNLTKNIKS